MKNKLKEAANNYACRISTQLDNYLLVRIVDDAFLAGARWIIDNLSLKDKNGIKNLSEEDISIILEDAKPSVIYVTPEEYQDIVKIVTDYIYKKE